MRNIAIIEEPTGRIRYLFWSESILSLCNRPSLLSEDLETILEWQERLVLNTSDWGTEHELRIKLPRLRNVPLFLDLAINQRAVML